MTRGGALGLGVKNLLWPSGKVPPTEMAQRLVAAACVLLVRCSASLRVALCVTGQLRTFDREAVRESQANRLVGDLRRQASSLDSFLVVSEALTNETRGWLQALYAPVSIDVTLDVRNHNFQYSMHATCGKRMRERERATGEAYAWAIKSRFDLFFYGPIPELASLSATAIHSRFRMYPFADEIFDVEMMSGEIQTGTSSGCSYPFPCGCSDPSRGEVRIDDQMAYVPAPFIGAYFDDILSLCYQRGWFPNSRSRHIPDPRDCACCKLTQSLLARNASLAPLVLHFTIVRAKSQYAARAGRGRLEGVFTDVPLDANGTRLGVETTKAWCEDANHTRREKTNKTVEKRRPFDPATDGASTLTKDWLRVRIDPEPRKKPAELEGRIVSFNLASSHNIESQEWSPPQRLTDVSRRGPDDHLRVKATGKRGSCDFDLSLAEYGVDWVLLSGTHPK